VADEKTGLEDEVKEAREVFGPIKECEWLPWAGEVLMVDFAREVEAEQQAEEEARQKAAEEEVRQKCEEEEQRWHKEFRE
jgi:hypothetical protein